MTPIDEAALKADPSDSEIMEIAGRWFHTGENQHRADGYYYRSLGTPTNVRGSDLIAFARALLHRSQPVAVVPAEQAEDWPSKAQLAKWALEAIEAGQHAAVLMNLEGIKDHLRRAAMSNREAGGS